MLESLDPNSDPKLVLHRLADNLIGWKRYGVDIDGEGAGMVVEDHERRGSRWGGLWWNVAHVDEVWPVESWSPKPACWASQGHRTRAEAVEALRAQLVLPPVITSV